MLAFVKGIDPSLCPPPSRAFPSFVQCAKLRAASKSTPSNAQQGLVGCRPLVVRCTTSTTQVRVQRFPQTQIDSALLPDKGLCTNRAFRKHDTIASFGSADVRLRLLLTQYRRLPFPAATAALIPCTCHCGATHMKLQATDDIPDNAILLFFHECGRHVGGVPRSSLKDRKTLHDDEITKNQNTTKPNTPKQQKPKPPQPKKPTRPQQEHHQTGSVSSVRE